MNDFVGLIHDHFTLAELEDLAFDLGIVWDHLPRRGTRQGAVRALVAYSHRNQQIPALLDELNRKRPFITWPSATSITRELERLGAASATPSDLLRQDFISKTRQAWIDGLLKNAIHKEIELTLNKRYNREAVSSFNPRLLQASDEPIPPETTILDIYEKTGRSLLILGEPASGKTILLLQLAESLLEQAEAHAQWPLPAVLNLASWASKQLPLEEWIAEELFTQQQTARTQSQRWLAENQLTLLLDGLDEVAETVRDGCVAAINAFQAAYPASLVVCSRAKDYEALQSQLNLATAIRLQPLTESQIDDYLAQFGAPLLPLRHSLRHDADLAQLAQSPLLVSLMALAYDEQTPQPDATASLAEKQQHLFATYQQRVFVHRPLATTAGYSQGQATQWLTNLAHGLTQHNLSIFYMEQLQLSWLPQRHLMLWPYRFIASLIRWLIIGLSSGLIVGLSGRSNDIFEGLFGGLFVGLIGGLSGGMSERWFFKELNRLSMIRSRLNIMKWGLLIGLAEGLIVGLIGGLRIGLLIGLFGGLIVGLFSGLIDLWWQGKAGHMMARFTVNVYQYLLQQYLQKGIEAVEDVSWQWPTRFAWWQGIKQGSLNGLIVGLIAGLFSGLNLGLNNLEVVDGLTQGLFVVTFAGVIGGLIGLIGGVIGGLIGGLQTVVQKQQIRYPLEPNQGIRATRRTLIRAGLPFTIIGTAIGASTGAFMLVPIFEGSVLDWNWTVLGLVVGLVGPLSYGGITLWRHYVLRWRLTRQGVLPFGISDKKLIAYLDDMAAHLLLRRVGGGWVFIHRTLQEYFAAQHPQAGQPLPPPPPIPQLD